MDWLIPTVAFFASILTFFSGFGLGTLLMAVLLFYYPPELAIAFTALVHFANSSFKIALNRKVDWQVFLQFGLMAMLAAVLGSYLLELLTQSTFTLYDLSRFGASKPVSLFHFIVGILLVVFAVFEWRTTKLMLELPLWLGGIISGFFGGISGHQGALRSAFLSSRFKDAKIFVATSSMIAWVVDLGRISMYSRSFNPSQIDLNLMIITLCAAFGGVLVGTYFLRKVTIPFIQGFVTIGLCVLGIAMLYGLI